MKCLVSVMIDPFDTRSNIKIILNLFLYCFVVYRNINWPPSPTLEDISLPQDRYTSIKSYNISKLCGLLLMHYLSYLWYDTGKSVFCAHPGSFIKSGLCRNWWAYEALYILMIPFSKSIVSTLMIDKKGTYLYVKKFCLKL